jgi:hypothetical protein
LVVALSIGKPLLNGVPCRGWRVPETDATPSILSVHIEETIQLIAGLNAEHHANATYHQRAVDRITSLLGRASFIATLLWGTTKIVLSSILLRHLHPLSQAQLPSSPQSLGRYQHYE